MPSADFSSLRHVWLKWLALALALFCVVLALSLFLAKPEIESVLLRGPRHWEWPADEPGSLPVKERLDSAWRCFHGDYWAPRPLCAMPAQVAGWFEAKPQDAAIRRYAASLLRDCRWVRPAPGPLGENRQVDDARFAAGGRRLVLATEKGIELWDIDAMRPLDFPLSKAGRHGRIAVSPDGRMLATLLAGVVRLWSVENGEPLAPAQARPGYRAPTFSPDGERLIFTDSELYEVWAVDGLRRIAPPDMPIQAYWRRTAAISPDGRRTLTESDPGLRPEYWQFFDTISEKPIGTVIAEGRDRTLKGVFSPDGKRCAVWTGGRWMLWDSEIGVPLGELGSGFDPPVFSADGRSIALTSFGAAVLRRAVDGSFLGGVKLPFSVNQIEFSPRGDLVAFGGGDQTRVLTTEPCAQVASLDTSMASAHRVAFDASGTQLATYWNDVSLWNPRTGHRLSEPFGDGIGSNAPLFSPDGRFLLTRTHQVARLWTLPAGGQRPIPLSHDANVQTLSFRAIDGALQTFDATGQQRIWEVEAGAESDNSTAVRRVPAHDRSNAYGINRKLRTSTSHSADGTCLALGFSTGCVVVVDASTLHPLTESLWHDGPVSAVALNHDGSRLAAAVGGTAWLWDLRTDLTGPLPAWLPDLCRAVSHLAGDHDSQNRSIDLAGLRQTVLSDPANGLWQRIGRSFFTPSDDGQTPPAR